MRSAISKTAATGCRIVSHGINRTYKSSPIRKNKSGFLANRLEIEDLRQNVIQDGIISISEATISIAAVVAIFIAATKALAEVEVIFASVYVIATIAVIRVPIGVRVFVVATPSVVPVCLSGAEALRITSV